MVGGIAVLLVGYQLFDAFSGPPTNVAPPPPVIKTVGPATASSSKGPAAVKLTTSAQLDPTLHEESMLVAESLVYTGSGRNIFAPGAPEAPPPVKLETAIYDARPKGPVTPPGPVQPPPPPPPPAIPLKFFGTETLKNGTKRAFLLTSNGDDVYVASVGDIVQRKYRVIAITANSIQMEDLPNANKQNLPYTAPQ